MDADKLLKLASKFEKKAQTMAQTPPPAPAPVKKKTPAGVLNVLKQTIKGVIDHPAIIPQAIDQVFNNFINAIQWASLGPTQQAEIKRKIMIAKQKQLEDMKRQLLELNYEIGKEMTLQNVQEE